MCGRVLAIAAIFMSAMLGGCSSSDDAPSPPSNSAEKHALPPDKPVPSPSPTQVTATPTPAAVSNTGAEAPKEAARSHDEQMMDDASATGMTARALRDDEASDDASEPSGNQ